MSSKLNASTPTPGKTSAGTEPPEALQETDREVPWLLRKVWDRMNRHNEHFVFTIVGREGSGKSYTAIRIAKEVDPTFDESRVLFDIADFLEILREGDHEPGQMFVLDEAGVSMGKRTWQERGQILANQALQLIRKHNLGLIFTLPRLSELDSQAEGRLHGYYEIMQKREGEFVRGKWIWLDPDRRDQTGEIYHKLPKRRENGRLQTLNSVAFRPPSGEVVTNYEARKDEFLEGFYDEVLGELNDKAESDNTNSLSPYDIANEIIENDDIELFSREDRRTGDMLVDRNLLYHKSDYDITHDEARVIKKEIEEAKGW